MAAFKHLLERLEHIEFTFADWCLGFLGIIFLRIFLENFSSIPATGNWTSDASTIIHYYLYYLAGTISLLLFLGLFVDRARLEKLSLFALVGNIAVPLLDLAISRGKGFLEHYIFLNASDLAREFFLFFTPFSMAGITPGLRIGAFLSLCILFVYVLYKTKNVFKAAAAAIGGYSIGFFWGALPSFWKLFYDFWAAGSRDLGVSQFFFVSEHISVIARNFLNPAILAPPTYGAGIFFNVAISQIYYVLIFFFIALYAYVRYRNVFKLITKRSFIRLVHGYLFISLGLLIGMRVGPAWISWNWVDLNSLIVLLIACFCARMYADGVNDIADLETDKISNPRRPLPSGLITEREVKNANIFFLAWTLLGGFLVGQYAFFAGMAGLLVSHMYSVRPLRLKRYPLIAPFLIAVASLAAFAVGFYFASPDKSTHALPAAYIFLILIGVTLGENVKDIKDIEGDKRDGVYTIPVLFGEKNGKKIIGMLAAIAFLLVPTILQLSALMLPSVIAAGAIYMLVNRRRYAEQPIFILLSLYAIVAVGIFFLS